MIEESAMKIKKRLRTKYQIFILIIIRNIKKYEMKKVASKYERHHE